MPDMQRKDGTIDIIVPESRKKEQHRRLSSHSSVIDWLDDESNSDEHVQFSTGYSIAVIFIHAFANTSYRILSEGAFRTCC